MTQRRNASVSPASTTLPASLREAPIFGPWSHPVTVTTLPVIWLLLLAFFNMQPEIDIAMTALVAAPGCIAAPSPDCAVFPVRASGVATALRETFHMLPALLSGMLVLSVIGDRLEGKPVGSSRIRLKLAPLATLALGPGLFVNGVLKPFVGRPRPVEIEVFGGVHAFMPAGEIATVSVGKSFVSGEAATAAWLVCLASLVRQSAGRLLAMRIAVAIALIWTAHRLLTGAHFLSDIVLGAVSTFVVFAVACVALEIRAHACPAEPA